MHFSFFFAILYLFGAHLDNLRRVLGRRYHCAEGPLLGRLYHCAEGPLLGRLYHCAKFCYHQCSSYANMNSSIFGEFCWETPIYAPKFGLLGLFDDLNGLQCQQKQKGTPLHDMNIWQAVYNRVA